MQIQAQYLHQEELVRGQRERQRLESASCAMHPKADTQLANKKLRRRQPEAIEHWLSTKKNAVSF